MSKAAIIGVGQSKFVRSYPGSIRELAFEGFSEAMQDAGMTTKDISASVICSAPEYDKQRSPAGVFAEYLGLNPNARIPTLVDGGTVLWESFAINLYLADKYEGPMHTASPEVRAQANQWSLWAALEVEPLALDLLHHRVALDKFTRDETHAERNESLLQRPLRILDGLLRTRPYLLDEGFTVADLNVASVLAWATRAKGDLSAVPEVARWLDTCLARSALSRVRGIVSEYEKRVAASD